MVLVAFGHQAKNSQWQKHFTRSSQQNSKKKMLTKYSQNTEQIKRRYSNFPSSPLSSNILFMDTVWSRKKICTKITQLFNIHKVYNGATDNNGNGAPNWEEG